MSKMVRHGRQRGSKGLRSVAVSAVALVVAALVLGSEAVFLPGFHANDYDKGEWVSPRMSEMRSSHTFIPYKYNSLGAVCVPPNGYQSLEENLGEYLLGIFFIIISFNF